MFSSLVTRPGALLFGGGFRYRAPRTPLNQVVVSFYFFKIKFIFPCLDLLGFDVIFVVIRLEVLPY